MVKRRHAAGAFDGEGARLHGGRWNSPGTAVVYAAESRALALLETLVAIRATGPLAAYVLFPVRFDAGLVRAIEPDELPGDWRASPPPASTRAIGDAFVAGKDSVVLRVPSVVVPAEYNYLIDPGHPEFGAVEVGAAEEVGIDPRLRR